MPSIVDRLIFKPVKELFGNDKLRLWKKIQDVRQFNDIFNPIKSSKDDTIYSKSRDSLKDKFGFGGLSVTRHGDTLYRRMGELGALMMLYGGIAAAGGAGAGGGGAAAGGTTAGGTTAGGTGAGVGGGASGGGSSGAGGGASAMKWVRLGNSLSSLAGNNQTQQPVAPQPSPKPEAQMAQNLDPEMLERLGLLIKLLGGTDKSGEKSSAYNDMLRRIGGGMTSA